MSGTESGDYQARVARVRVRILSHEFEYEGYVHLLAETRRIQEVLNDPKPFLNLTDAWIVDRVSGADSGPHTHVAIHKGCINHLFECAPTLRPQVRPRTAEEDAEPEAELTLDGDSSAFLTGELVEADPDDDRA